jgi:hypothetical protein
MQSGSDDEIGVDCRFTYTLDAIKYCGGANLLIRYCCDQAYYEIIENNGVAVGASFSDTEGYCWTVFEETTSFITGFRTKSTDYVHCAACIENNPCPNNYKVISCCDIDTQSFVPVMPGVSVNYSFVDTYGNCWYVDDTTSQPITNVVFAGTVYVNTDCNEGICVDDNPCPTFYLLQSCCYRGDLQGITTSIILGPTYVVNDVFVDQFGICWLVKEEIQPRFPTLAFVTPVTDFGVDGCVDCTTDNNCPSTLFYEVQNCCTEDIEVLEWSPTLNIGNVWSFYNSVYVIECYKILAFTTGPATITLNSTISDNYNCAECINQWMQGQCPPTP